MSNQLLILIILKIFSQINIQNNIQTTLFKKEIRNISYHTTDPVMSIHKNNYPRGS